MSTAALPLPDAEPAKPGKKKLLVLLVIVFAVLAAGGGGAAWWFHQKAASAEAKPGEEAKAEKKESKPPVFNTLEAFTVNLTGGDHFLQLGIVLQLKDDTTAEKVKTYLPMIRNRILLLLSSKSAEELESPKGKEALIGQLLAETRGPLGTDGENVQAILLGSMLIQ